MTQSPDRFRCDVCGGEPRPWDEFAGHNDGEHDGQGFPFTPYLRSIPRALDGGPAKRGTA